MSRYYAVGLLCEAGFRFGLAHPTSGSLVVSTCEPDDPDGGFLSAVVESPAALCRALNALRCGLWAGVVTPWLSIEPEILRLDPISGYLEGQILPGGEPGTTRSGYACGVKGRGWAVSGHGWKAVHRTALGDDQAIFSPGEGGGRWYRDLSEIPVLAEKASVSAQAETTYTSTFYVEMWNAFISAKLVMTPE